MNDKFKNFLSNGFEKNTVEVKEEEEEIVEEYDEEPTYDEYQESVEELKDTISALQAQITELQMTVKDLRENPPFPDMSPFVTTREQIKSLTNAIDRQNVEITNKALLTSMEQIAIMREDFFKLCGGMRKKIDSMTAGDVLSSFEAYQVDMENILADGGVFIGHFPYDSLNTIHQRIVDVVPTDDPEKNGLIAERISDGYKLGDRVLLKEKVTVYKYTEPAAETASDEQSADEESTEEPTETASETTSKKRTKAKKENKTENTEEEE